MNYQGQTEAIHTAAPEAQDMTSRRTRRRHAVDEVERRKNRAKARVRSKVEWPFRILKRVFWIYQSALLRTEADSDLHRTAKL
jgi:IS5 family transposase